MAVRGIDDDDVAFRLDQRERAPQAVLAHARRRGDAQAAALVLAGVGIFLRLLDVLDRDQTDAAIGLVDDEDLLDAMLMQQTLGFFGANAFAHGDELVLRHQLAHGLAHVGGEAHVAVGQDADELARALAVLALDHRDAGDAIALHQRERVGERGIGRDGDRVDHHAAFELLHAADLLGLLLDGEILVDHAHAAGLRHGDGETGFGHGVHGGGDQRDAEFDGPGEAGAGVDLAGKNVRRSGHQKNIVEGKRFADGHGPVLHLGAPRLYQPFSRFARSSRSAADSCEDNGAWPTPTR